MRKQDSNPTKITNQKMKNKNTVSLIAILFFALFLQANHVEAASLRQTISLDGVWQIAEGNMTNIPTVFDGSVPVPGLVALATPGFVEPGPKVANRNALPQKDPRRDAFWYRRWFTLDGPIPVVAQLKIAKAMFGTRVFLNGKLLGDHAPCFTPGYFDTASALKTGTNELIVRVGADRDAVGRVHPDGFDFEKERYIPGIFDSVTLILSGTPNIENVQIAPDLSNRQAHVRVWLKGNGVGEVSFEIREAKSGKISGSATAQAGVIPEQAIDVMIPVSDCHAWSPEDPFLYKLTVRTRGDEFTTRFGMREFRFDPATGRAMLNGKPYFMRGSNITLYRFFEDSECGDLPWNEKWVRQLHQRVKDMHWNCLRYCIGFPPEKWYDIADESGLLIDDEFPVWFGGDVPKEMEVDGLANEYAEWIRERWNHPSVVIWDACNETLATKTGAAIQQVRRLDLSHRPFNDGYTKPHEDGDMYEVHPYHYYKPNIRLINLATADLDPQKVEGGRRKPMDKRGAYVINEYGWLWLDRDGTPTTLTKDIYRNLLGTNSTSEQRFHLQATYLAADTEFWRAHRKAAAVMHFTTLGYSRPDGQTSDHWQPGGVARLEWEPEFYNYVRDAFAPVGLMMEYWSGQAIAGTTTRVPLTLINDLYEAWTGPVTLRVKQNDHVLVETSQTARIDALATTNIVFEITWPNQSGASVLSAELIGAEGKPVYSVRDVMIK